MKTPILETERILLRPLSVNDAETIYKNWTSDEDVAKFMIWNVHRNVEETREWLRAEESNIEKDTNYTWGFVLKENGELFGSGGIGYNESYGIYELGYNIMKGCWNQGLTTEASKAMIGFAYKQLGIKTFLGRHAKDNIASGRVLHKLGFVYKNESTYTKFNAEQVFASLEYLLRME